MIRVLLETLDRKESQDAWAPTAPTAPEDLLAHQGPKGSKAEWAVLDQQVRLYS